MTNLRLLQLLPVNVKLLLSLNGPLIMEKVFADEIDILKNIAMLLYLGNKHNYLQYKYMFMQSYIKGIFFTLKYTTGTIKQSKHSV